MGALNSIHTKLTNLTEESEDTDPEFSTPQKPLKHKCLLNVDPRSPSEDINRTPIVVDETPNIHSSKAVKSRISIQQIEGPVDPRSPSAEITRTPLCFGQASSVNCETPLKAPSDLTCQTAFDHKNSQTRNGQEPGQVGPLSEEERTFDNVLSSTDGNLEESVDTEPLLVEGTKKLAVSSNYGTMKNATAATESEIETDNLFPSQGKLRCRQVNRLLNKQTSSPAKARSPLTLVENSPRISQVQKKTVPAGGKTDLYINSSAIDKENVCH